MSPIIQSIARLTVPIIIGCCVAVFAQTEKPAPPAQKTHDLESQLKAQRAKVAELERELTETKKAAKKEQGDGKNEDQQKPKKTYSSALEILRDLPDGFQPHRATGWEGRDLSKVQGWLKEEPAGKRFEANLQVESISVYENRNPATSPDSSKKEKWRIVVRVVPVNKTYSGVNVHQTVTGFQLNSFELYAGDHAADKARRVKKGHPVRVSGKISKVAFGSMSKTSCSLDVCLSDYTLKSSFLE